MKIVVNNIAASTGGAMSILKDFYEYIKENDKENEWIFLLSDNYLEETENIKILLFPKVKSNWMNRLKFDYISGKSVIKKIKPDVIFSLQNTVIFGLTIPQILYVHQPLPFQEKKKFSLFKSKERPLAIYQYIIGYFIKKSIRKANKVIVQTQWMKKVVIQKSKIKTEKIVNLFPNVKLASSSDKNINWSKDKFFYPTSECLYKNNECIYLASNILKSRNINKFNIKLTINNQSLKDENVSFIGKINHENVMSELCKSTLIFPSYIETFGLPLLEARKMGTVVLASDCDFSREILNGYENAYFFDPFNANELADLMSKVINGEIIKKDVVDNFKCDQDSWKEVVDIIKNEKGVQVL